MKNVKNIVLILVGIQLFVAEGLSKNPVGRPKKIQMEKHPFEAPRKVGRPAKYGPKYDTRLALRNVPAVIEQSVPLLPAVKKLGFGLRVLRGGAIGTVLGYVGENIFSILADSEQREAVKNRFSPHKESVTKIIHEDNSSLVSTNINLYNTPIIKGGLGALCIAGLGYAAYKIYEKIHEKYVKKNNALNNVTM